MYHTLIEELRGNAQIMNTCVFGVQDSTQFEGARDQWDRTNESINKLIDAITYQESSKREIIKP